MIIVYICLGNLHMKTAFAITKAGAFHDYKLNLHYHYAYSGSLSLQLNQPEQQ